MSRIVVPAHDHKTHVGSGCVCRWPYHSGIPVRPAFGVVIDGSQDGTIKINKSIGHHDNNVAEYAALLEALQFAVELGARTLHVFSDSEVVVKQMRQRGKPPELLP